MTTMGITAGQIAGAHAVREGKRSREHERSQEMLRLAGGGFFRPLAATGTHVDRPHTMLAGPVEMPPLMTEVEL